MSGNTWWPIIDALFSLHTYIYYSPDESSQRIAQPSLPLDKTYCDKQENVTLQFVLENKSHKQHTFVNVHASDNGNL